MKAKLENELWEITLKNAVMEYTLKELEKYPLNEIQDIQLPQRYITVMRKFFYKYQLQKKSKIYTKTLRKIASWVLIVLGISFSILLFNEQVRAACKKVFIEVYNRYIEFIYNSPDDSQNLTFVPEYIPDGFELIDSYSLEDIQFMIWENPEKEKITLSCFKNDHTLQIDNEHYIIENIQINNFDGKYFSSFEPEFENILVWNDDKMYYMLSSHLKREILINIAKNIK